MKKSTILNKDHYRKFLRAKCMNACISNLGFSMLGASLTFVIVPNSPEAAFAAIPFIILVYQYINNYIKEKLNKSDKFVERWSYTFARVFDIVEISLFCSIYFIPADTVIFVKVFSIAAIIAYAPLHVLYVKFIHKTISHNHHFSALSIAVDARIERTSTLCGLIGAGTNTILFMLFDKTIAINIVVGLYIVIRICDAITNSIERNHLMKSFA